MQEDTLRRQQTCCFGLFLWYPKEHGINTSDDFIALRHWPCKWDPIVLHIGLVSILACLLLQRFNYVVWLKTTVHKIRWISINANLLWFFWNQHFLFERQFKPISKVASKQIENVIESEAEANTPDNELVGSYLNIVRFLGATGEQWIPLPCLFPRNQIQYMVSLLSNQCCELYQTQLMHWNIPLWDDWKQQIYWLQSSLVYSNQHGRLICVLLWRFQAMKSGLNKFCLMLRNRFEQQFHSNDYWRFLMVSTSIPPSLINQLKSLEVNFLQIVIDERAFKGVENLKYRFLLQPSAVLAAKSKMLFD